MPYSELSLSAMHAVSNPTNSLPCLRSLVGTHRWEKSTGGFPSSISCASIHTCRIIRKSSFFKTLLWRLSSALPPATRCRNNRKSRCGCRLEPLTRKGNLIDTTATRTGPRAAQLTHRIALAIHNSERTRPRLSIARPPSSRLPAAVDESPTNVVGRDRVDSRVT